MSNPDEMDRLAKALFDATHDPQWDQLPVIKRNPDKFFRGVRWSKAQIKAMKKRGRPPLIINRIPERT